MSAVRTNGNWRLQLRRIGYASLAVLLNTNASVLRIVYCRKPTVPCRSWDIVFHKVPLLLLFPNEQTWQCNTAKHHRCFFTWLRGADKPGLEPKCSLTGSFVFFLSYCRLEVALDTPWKKILFFPGRRKKKKLWRGRNKEFTALFLFFVLSSVHLYGGCFFRF